MRSLRPWPATGQDAKVAVLPFARYQLPRDAIRMPAEVEPMAQAAE